MNRSSNRIQILAAASRHVDLRLTELFARFQQIEWMDWIVSNPHSADNDIRRPCLALAIKDFHIDVASLMDSLAPVIIQIEGHLKTRDKEHPPGWATLSQGAKADYRKNIRDSELLLIVDSTERWWPIVKQVRNLLVHREHIKIIFGKPSDGILFQIYEATLTPKIIDADLLYQRGKNVVDFTLYSATVLAEILCLLDDIGRHLALQMKIASDGIAPSMRLGYFKNIVGALEHLLQVRNVDSNY